MPHTITRSWKALSFIIIVALVVLVARFVYHETRIPQNQGDVLNRMIELQREGRYDKAVQVVQNWMNDSRRKTSLDGFMFEEIAFVYIAKAYKKPATRDESVRRAEDNLQKALAFFDGQGQSEFSLDPFEIGGVYEAMADISDKDKCRFYEKARGLFVRQLPLIKGESYTAYGKTILLEPVRGDVRKHLNAVNEKSSKAGCQAQAEQ
jgi:hypothetical protein